MVSLYKDGLNEKDISELNKLNLKISDEYSSGKINNEQYTNLKKEISVLYEEIFENEIDSLNENLDRDRSGEIQLDRITKEVNDAYIKDRINSDHYSVIRNEISLAYKKIFNCC